MKTKNILFIFVSLCIGSRLAAMAPAPSSLHDQLVQIFEYSEACPDKQCIVEVLSCELDAVRTLLALVDTGKQLSVVQEAALYGLLDKFMHVLPHDLSVAIDMRSQLMMLRLCLQGKIKTKRPLGDVSIFYNPDYRNYPEQIDRSYCSSPDQP